jgi:hypothetical protein
MKAAEERLAEARIEEKLARARWFDSVKAAQVRTTPSNIADEAIGQIREHAGRAAAKVGDAARKRPGTLIASGAAIGLFLFRKPIAGALLKRFRRRKETPIGAEALPAQKHTDIGPRPDPTPKTITEEVGR